MNPPIKKPQWIRRNGKWFVPLVVILLMGCCLLGALAALLDVFGSIRGSAVYQQGLTMVHRDERVRDELGAPIESGWFYSGEINDEKAAIVFNISGPKGDGSVQIEGEQSGGIWTVTYLRVYTRGPVDERDIVIVGE